MNTLNLLALLFQTQFKTDFKQSTRTPVVTIMGHVDHGKTTLMDYLRQTQVAKSELGGITQKISGFTIRNQFGEFSFIDTPGHVFFQDMRVTGASAADLVILIVSAVEGVQEQTKEVLKLLNEFKVPFIVCLNKIDVQGIDPEMVEEQLVEEGVDLEPYGGSIPIVYISAWNGQGVDLLLELIQETAKEMKLKAAFDDQAQVRVIESRIDLETQMKRIEVVVQEGVVKPGDVLLTNKNYFKVFKIVSSLGETIPEGEPGQIVELIGPGDLVSSQQTLVKVESESQAKTWKELQDYLEYQRDVQTAQNVSKQFWVHYKNRKERKQAYHSDKYMQEKMKDETRILLEKLTHGKDLSQEERTKIRDQLLAISATLKQIQTQESQVNPLMIKVVDQGAVRTVLNLIGQMKRPAFTVMKIDCNPLILQEIQECQQNKTSLVTFGINLNQDQIEEAKKLKVQFNQFGLIYDLVNHLESYGQLEVEQIEEKQETLGTAVIKKIFNIQQKSNEIRILGCQLISGRINKLGSFNLYRGKNLIQTNLKAVSLKIKREEKEEIDGQMEFGIQLEQMENVQEGDTLECSLENI